MKKHNNKKQNDSHFGVIIKKHNNKKTNDVVLEEPDLHQAKNTKPAALPIITDGTPSPPPLGSRI